MFDKKRYSTIAIKKETKKELKREAVNSDMQLVDLIDEMLKIYKAFKEVKI